MKKEWPFCLLREAKWGVASMPMGTDVALVIGSPSEEALVYMPVSFASFTGISTSFSNETNLCIVESHRILLRCWLLYGRISDTGPFHPLMNYKACGVFILSLRKRSLTLDLGQKDWQLGKEWHPNPIFLSCSQNGTLIEIIGFPSSRSW